MDCPLDAQGYFKQQLLHAYAPNHKLYKGLSLTRKISVLIEEHHFPNNRSANIYFREIQALRSLSHPRCAEILDVFESFGTTCICWIVFEYLGSELSTDRVWAESELRIFLEEVVEMMSDAQGKKLYFRGIGMGSFRFQEIEECSLCNLSAYYDLGDSKMYASPAVCNYINDDEEDEESLGSALPFHNPYKSEVYSLGIVLLRLSLSHEVLVGSDSSVLELVEQLTVSDSMKDVMKKMLVGNEEERLDPTELHLLLQGEIDLSDPGVQSARRNKHREHITRIECRLEEQLRLSLTKSISSAVFLKCVCCFQMIRIQATSLVEELALIIPLKCTGKSHIFCSEDCLLKYSFIETKGRIEAVENLQCPICNEYKFPSEIVAMIREKWRQQSSGLPRTLTRSKKIAENESKRLRFSQPSLMPIDSSSADIVLRHCIYCNSTVKEGAISAHAESDHYFCSGQCIEAYASTLPELPNLESIPCSACDGYLDIASISEALGCGVDDIRWLFRVREAAQPIEFKSHCLRCQQVILLDENYVPISGLKPVFLYCDPPNHVFCSSHCVQNFVEEKTQHHQLNLTIVTCPQCQVPIEPSLIFDCYEGEENYRCIVHEVRASFATTMLPLLCMECHEREGERAPCGHSFCDSCMKGWCTHLLRNRWYKVMPCPKCGQSIDVERFRRHSNSFTNLLSTAKHKLLG